MNYYQEKLIKIKNLIKNDKKRALFLINEELSMPYIPEKYEIEFLSLAEKLEFDLKDNKKVTKLSKDEIIEYLFSDDKMKVAKSIDALRSINIRILLNDIEKWIFLNPQKSLEQAIIYEILVEQEINKTISFGNIRINPVKDGLIMDQREIKVSFRTILDSNESPQIQEAAIEELKFYILKTFPQIPKNGSLLAKELMSVIKSLLENKNHFSGYQLDIFNIIKQK